MSSLERSMEISGDLPRGVKRPPVEDLRVKQGVSGLQFHREGVGRELKDLA
jgi:hypothetical protein